jgi:hypothetical protein
MITKSAVTTVPIASLVLDYDLYPRVQVDSQHAHYLAEALRAGARLPPVIVDKRSKRVIDGFHRIRAHQTVYGESASIEAELREYRSDADMFLDAMRLNASHGRSLTKCDRARCVLQMRKFRIGANRVAAALGMTLKALQALGEGRVARAKDGAQVPLKRTIAHMAGQTLTDEQIEANDKLSGMNQAFYAHQLLLLIRSGLIDTSNEELMAALRRLYEALGELLL